MTLKKTIEHYLEIEPKARERRNKDRAIVNLLLKRYHSLETALNGGLLTKDELVVQDYNTLDRCWRKALEEIPRLRGSDYDEKDRLEENKLEELGYRTPEHSGPGEAVEEDNQLTLL